MDNTSISASRKRKKIAGVVSLAIVVVLLLSSTYAWQYNNLHKTTEGSAEEEAIMKSIQLVDHSEEITDWKVNESKYRPKRLEVINDGADGTTGTPRFQDVYVRVVLKEYMERLNSRQDVYINRLMIDENGEFVSYPDKASAQAAWPGHTAVKLTNALSATPTAERWFVETKKGDPNGQYGNFMTTSIVSETERIAGNSNSAAWLTGSGKATVPSSNTANYPGDYHTDGETEECAYTPISWEGVTNTPPNYANKNTKMFRDLVEIKPGAGVQFLSQYSAGGSHANDTLSKGAYWLVDDTTEKIYAYWMQPLAPGGPTPSEATNSKTTALTSGLKLIKSPNGTYQDALGNDVEYPLNFYYALHADLDPTLAADYATDWAGMDTGIKDVLFSSNAKSGSFKISFVDGRDLTTLTSGSVTPIITDTTPGATQEYSLDGGARWTPFNSGDTIQVPAGEILFRGTGRTALFDSASDSNGWTLNSGSGKAKVEGNLNTMLDYANPPTAVGDYAFAYMFNSTSIISAPDLPATTLGENCYDGMFAYCTDLVTVPNILPATTLASGCYGYMFYSCSSLVKAPGLPASTLVSYCYENMFGDCTSLNSVTVGFTDWRPTNATQVWLKNTASGGIFNCPAGLNTSTRGDNTVPASWSVNP